MLWKSVWVFWTFFRRQIFRVEQNLIFFLIWKFWKNFGTRFALISFIFAVSDAAINEFTTVRPWKVYTKSNRKKRLNKIFFCLFLNKKGKPKSKKSLRKLQRISIRIYWVWAADIDIRPNTRRAVRKEERNNRKSWGGGVGKAYFLLRLG